MSQSSITVMCSTEVGVDDVLRAVDDQVLVAECARRGMLAIGDDPVVSGADIRAERGLLDWSLFRSLSGATCISRAPTRPAERQVPA